MEIEIPANRVAIVTGCTPYVRHEFQRVLKSFQPLIVTQPANSTDANPRRAAVKLAKSSEHNSVKHPCCSERHQKQPRLGRGKTFLLTLAICDPALGQIVGR